MSEIRTASPGVELLDIVDVFGIPTGETKEREEIHADGDAHRDVHAWLTDGVNFLQQQRSQNKTIMGGEWDISAAEHVAAGESYLEAAKRGVSEELGLDIPEEDFIFAGRLGSSMEFPGWKKPHNTVGDNFIVYRPDLSSLFHDITIQPSEVEDVRLYNIPQMMSDLSKPETRGLHASHPLPLYVLGATAMLGVAQR